MQQPDLSHWHATSSYSPISCLKGVFSILSFTTRILVSFFSKRAHRSILQDEYEEEAFLCCFYEEVFYDGRPPYIYVVGEGSHLSNLGN